MINCSIDYDKKSKLGIAVSGGIDSMALLHYAIYKIGSKSIVVINIEHGIRGDSSNRDSKFVEDECKRLGVDCIRINIDSLKYAKENSLTVEQAARELRYREFDKLLASAKVSTICLAHHRSDQAETILMRILRGTGISGLRGIPKIRDKYQRPFIDISQKEIEEYVKTNKIRYIQDESNNDNTYTRNYIRNIILPEIEKLYPDYEKALARLSENASEDYDYILQSSLVPKMDKGVVSIPVGYLKEAKSIVRATIIECFRLLGVLADIERIHIEKIISMYNLNNGDSLDMPHNIIVFREYNKLVFSKKKSYDTIVIPFAKGSYKFGEYILDIEEYQTEGLVFDYNKIPSTAVIRSRKEGDKFKKFSGGTKSLGDYMTDVKLPKRIRNYYPIIANDMEVLIVPGYEISDSVKVDNKTKNKFTIQCRSIYD